MKSNSRLSFLAVAMILLATQLFATDGYFRHGYGVKYSAIGGAGTALSLSSIGAATNPAGLAFLGDRYDVNVALFSPTRSFTVTGNPSQTQGTFGLMPGSVESESNYFPTPSLGANWMLNETMALGVMFYGNGGMNTDYPTAVFFDPNSQSTGVNLEQMFFGVTYAIEFAEDHSFGITPIFAFQRFAAKGLFNFSNFSQDASALTGNHVSTSTGFGGRIGYQGKLLPYLSFGVSYQMKFAMSEFEEYKGLFAEDGDFDIPASWNVGIAVMPNDDWTFAFDVKQILYSGVKSINNPLNPMTLAPAFPDGQGGFTPNPKFAPLGSENGAGFGWEDIMAYKFGVIYGGLEGWTFMAGFSHNENPIPDSEMLFNILAPGVVQNHITFGITKEIDESNEVIISFMLAPEGSVNGVNPLDPPAKQNIELNMSQWQLEIGYAFH
jgi:long-chain fatty acid transport protein